MLAYELVNIVSSFDILSDFHFPLVELSKNREIGRKPAEERNDDEEFRMNFLLPRVFALARDPLVTLLTQP